MTEPFKAKQRGKLLRELKTDIPYHVMNYLNKKQIGVLDLDTYGNSPFWYAVHTGAAKTVDYFLTNKLAEVNAPIFEVRARYSSSLGTALHFASHYTAYDPTDMIDVLVRHGANINAPTNKYLYMTPLIVAIDNVKSQFQKEAIASLVSHGAECLKISKNINNRDDSPFVLALSHHNSQAVHYILESFKNIWQLESAKELAKKHTSFKMPQLVLEIEALIEKRKIEEVVQPTSNTTKISSKI